MNIPNALSLFRMALVPCFLFAFFSGHPYAMFYSAGIYALAGITDVLDGIIARKFDMITKLGKILDPLADKMMTITVFICITIRGIIPWWMIILIFAKDLLQVIGGVKLYRENSSVFSANSFGKATTVFLVTCGVLIMLFEHSIPIWAKTVFVWIAILMSLATFLSYLQQYLRFRSTHGTSDI